MEIPSKIESVTGKKGKKGMRQSDMGSIYRDIVVGPKYRPFSDISLCICCIYDRTFPENIVVISFMTCFSHKILLWSHLWQDIPIFHIIRGGSGHQDSSIIPLSCNF